jgi:hypothetical protein
VKDLLSNVGAGDGGAPVPAGGAPTAGGAAPAAAAAEAEKPKEEEKEESDDDMVRYTRGLSPSEENANVSRLHRASVCSTKRFTPYPSLCISCSVGLLHSHCTHFRNAIYACQHILLNGRKGVVVTSYSGRDSVDFSVFGRSPD